MNSHHPHNQKSSAKKHLAVFAIFGFILLAILYPIFFGDVSDFSLTGDSVATESSSTSLTSFDFSATLSVPEYSGKGTFAEIDVVSSSDSVLYVGDKEFELKDGKNYVEITDYSGKIGFNKDKITLLSGEAAGISLNGVSLRSRSGGTVSVEFEKDFTYSSLEIKDSFSSKELSYEADGTINIDSNTLRVSKQNIILNNFNGDIEISKNKLNFEGTLTKFEIDGSPKVVFSV